MMDTCSLWVYGVKDETEKGRKIMAKERAEALNADEHHQEAARHYREAAARHEEAARHWAAGHYRAAAEETARALQEEAQGALHTGHAAAAHAGKLPQ